MNKLNLVLSLVMAVQLMIMLSGANLYLNAEGYFLASGGGLLVFMVGATGFCYQLIRLINGRRNQ